MFCHLLSRDNSTFPINSEEVTYKFPTLQGHTKDKSNAPTEILLASLNFKSSFLFTWEDGKQDCYKLPQSKVPQCLIIAPKRAFSTVGPNAQWRISNGYSLKLSDTKISGQELNIFSVISIFFSVKYRWKRFCKVLFGFCCSFVCKVVLPICYSRFQKPTIWLIFIIGNRFTAQSSEYILTPVLWHTISNMHLQQTGLLRGSCWIITVTTAVTIQKTFRNIFKWSSKSETLSNRFWGASKNKQRWWTPSWNRLHGEKCKAEKFQVKHYYLCILNW